MIVLAICWVEGATSCRETTIKSLLAAAIGTRGSKINSRPIAFLRGRIWIGGPNYFRDSHHCFVLAAVIEKNFIALPHFTKIVSGRVIAHASPTGLPFRDKVGPRIRGWFLFHEPEIFHAVMSTAPIILVIPNEVEDSRGITQGFQWDSLISLCCARDDGSCEGGVVI